VLALIAPEISCSQSADVPKVIATPPGERIEAVNFSPDGRLLAFSAANIVSLWDLDDGRQRWRIQALGLVVGDADGRLADMIWRLLRNRSECAFNGLAYTSPWVWFLDRLFTSRLLE
jgi:WD40 repeat protein